MLSFKTLSAFIAATAVLAVFPLHAQDSEIREDALSVFLDCDSRSCDDDYLRTEIDYVNWVRDRTLADVHLIISFTSTGGGGQLFTLDYIGLGDLAGTGDELTYTTNTTDTSDENISGLTHTIAVGLVRYAVLAGKSTSFEINSLAVARSDSLTDRLVSAEEVEDPWNFWVFEIGTELDMREEETRKDENYGLSFEASRTTETWKFEFDIDGDFSRDERERGNGTIIVDERDSWGSDVLLAYSLADHWSLGVESGVGSASRRNEDLSGSIFTILEYSVYPYVEAPRRSFTARYDIGMRYFDWTEITVFDQESETRGQHRFELEYYQRQPWGNLTASVDASQYLHDTSLWNVSLNGNLSFRITRGLNISFRGDYSLIEDQLFISRAGLTDEEILLGQFDRPTDYELSFRLGINYEFGSIYNNVVNNRFGGGGGFFR